MSSIGGKSRKRGPCLRLASALTACLSLGASLGIARAQEPASDTSAGAAGGAGASIGPAAPGSSPGEGERLRDTALLGRPALPKDKPDLLGLLKEHAELHRFAELVEAAGLGQSLHGRGPLTVFAPSDKAFRSMPSGMLDELLKDKSRLKRVASYHILRALVPAKKVAILRNALTMSGYVVPIDGEHGIKVGGAQLTDRDQWAKNGVVHVIDSVLLPKEPASSSSSASAKKRKGAEHEGGADGAEPPEETSKTASVPPSTTPAQSAPPPSVDEKAAAKTEPAATPKIATSDGDPAAEKSRDKKSKKKKSRRAKKERDLAASEAAP